MNQISDGFWSETAWQAVETEHLPIAWLLPCHLHCPSHASQMCCTTVGNTAGRGVSSLSERARQYLKWLAIKAESIDALHRNLPSPQLWIRVVSHGSFWTELWQDRQAVQGTRDSLSALRFSSLIATFLTIRLRRQMNRQSAHASADVHPNVDADYLNYPRALKNLLQLFPEYQSMFYFEVMS